MSGEPVVSGWVGTKEAAAITGYSEAWMRRLAKDGRIKARKVGRDWLLDLAELAAYQRRMSDLGTQKHDSTRKHEAEGGSE